VASSAFMMTEGSASIVVVVIGSSMPSRLQHRCHHHRHHHNHYHGHGGSLFIVGLFGCSLLCCILCVCKLP